MSRHFGPIRQLGYVVKDIQAAIQYWHAALGVGPFFYFEQAPIRDLRYRGEPNMSEVAFALAQTGPTQIELIMPRDNLPSLYNDFIDRHGEGLQHIAYWAEDITEWEHQAQASGMTCVLSGCTGDAAGRFAYYAGEGHAGTCVEFSALSDAKKALFEDVARASVDWDGQAPLRRYSLPL
jgi:catechol 2,3-dioxygenase-like lactoylglutathione lyase family enzyme